MTLRDEWFSLIRLLPLLAAASLSSCEDKSPEGQGPAVPLSKPYVESAASTLPDDIVIRKETTETEPTFITNTGPEDPSLWGPLIEIEASPAKATMLPGSELVIRVLAKYQTGYQRLVHSLCDWSVDHASVVSVGSTTEKSAVAATGTGDAQVTANCFGKSVTIPIEVRSPTIESILIAPSTILVGFQQRLTATGVFSDGTTIDLSDQVAWQSNDAEVAEFLSDSDGSTGLVRGKRPGTFSALVSYGGLSVVSAVDVKLDELSTIEISAPAFQISVGTRGQFTALGRFANGTTMDVTSFATWTVDRGDRASVTSMPADAGKVQGLRSGAVTLRAELEGTIATLPFQVLAASFTHLTTIPAGTLSLPLGLAEKVIVLGHLSDGSSSDITSQVQWELAADPELALTIDGPDAGKVEAKEITAGAKVLKVSYGDLDATLQINVTAATLQTLEIALANLDMPPGTIDQPFKCGVEARSPWLTATGHFSDGDTREVTNDVTWVISNPAAAEIRNQAGHVLLVGLQDEKFFTISAQMGAVVSPTFAVHTVDPDLLTLSIAAENPAYATEAPVGTDVRFKATAAYTCSVAANKAAITNCAAPTATCKTATTWSLGTVSPANLATICSTSTGNCSGKKGALLWPANSPAGTLTGTDFHQMNVSATYDGVTKVIPGYIVRPPLISRICAVRTSIESDSTNIREGLAAQLSVRAETSFSNELCNVPLTASTPGVSITWTSRNPAVGTVSASGLFVGSTISGVFVDVDVQTTSNPTSGSFTDALRISVIRDCAENLGGNLVYSYCYYIGNVGDSCDQVCTPKVVDTAATASCSELANKFSGLTGGFEGVGATTNVGLGCYIDVNFGFFRNDSTGKIGAASDPSARRVCACFN